MDSKERQAEISDLIFRIHEKQQEIERARKNNVVFSDIKKLYLELKDLNRKLTTVLEQVKLSPDSY